MKIFTKCIPAGLLVLLVLFAQALQAQSILNPADSVYTYSATATAGTPTNPNQPAANTIGKWVRTVRMSYPTNEWKCYIYNGVCFRLHFPLGYNPTANDGKVYPLLVFWHGDGESGAITDNEESMAHGGQTPFQTGSDAGTWPGYILIPQNTNGGWDPNAITDMKQVMDYMITNNKLDPFHIVSNGLSAGGLACWDFIQMYPQYVAANLPMSSVNQQDGSAANLALTKFTPLWSTVGELDTWPDTTDAGIENRAELAAGADFTYTLYTTLGHDTWDSTWEQPNFWPFMNQAYASNPWALHGQTAFCPGVTVKDTLGVAPQYQAYQWRMNGTVIPSATTNTLIISQLGTYDCRVERNGVWSDWSHTPAVISTRQPTVTPPIAVSGLESFVIPSVSQSNVILQVPAGYASYVWEKVGSSTVISTANTLNVTTPGQYIVEVTQAGGCSSSFSSPFTVVGAPGTNTPDPASDVSAAALTQTSVLVNWNQNPSPAHNEVNFEVYQGTKSGGPYQLVAITGPDASKDTITGLTSGTKYYYVIRAVDSTGASTTSNEASISTVADIQPPTAPGSLTITGSTYSSISLSWTASTDNVGVVAYDIYINGVKSYTVKPNVSTFSAYGLTNGQNYTFVVKARDAAGNVSASSDQVSGEALLNGISYNYYDNLPTTISALPNYSTLTPTFSGSIPNISLSPAVDVNDFGFLYQGMINIPVAGTYTFQIGSDDGSAMYLGPLNGTSAYAFGSTPTINDDGAHGTVNVNSSAMTLQAGLYPFAIAYFQQGGGTAMLFNWETPGSKTFVAVPNSAFQQTAVVYGTAPAYPTAVTAAAINYKSIGLTWTDNSNNESGFEIYRSTSVAGTYSILTTVAANTTSYTDSSCQASTTYYYKVQAINQYGGSGYDPAQMSGLTYWYFTTTSNWINLAQLNSMTPVSTGTLTNFSLSPATQSNDFAFKYMGYINIKKAGTYTFYTASDDGSDLWVGGYDSAHLIVKSDFAQGVTTRSGTVNLSVGRYPIYVAYYQDGGGTALTVSYKGPGITNQTTIPDSAFYASSTNFSATTRALPAVPAKPTNLTVATVTATSVTLNWQDTATNATSFQIYRSATNDQSYVLLATVPSSVFSYKDSSLFSDAKYYYKVEATNVGGSSAFTAEDSVTTLDIAPVVAKIANQQVRYGTTTVIPVSATVSGGGTVTLTGSGLPAFAVLTDNGGGLGKITLNPAKTDSGTYNGLTVTATDSYGGTASTQFNIWVNHNYAPTLDSIVNYSMPAGDTLTIPLIGQDSIPTDTLTYTVANAPSGYIINQGTAGSGSLVLEPSYVSAGTYNIQVTLNDKNGLSVTRGFTLTITKNSPIQRIYTRVKYQATAPAPWNNLTGTVTNNLLDQNGNVTPVGMTFSPTNWWSPYNGGPTTGNNSGVYPDVVLQEYYYFGFFSGPANPTITISGLNANKKYDLTFFASSVLAGVGDNGVTSYSSGSQTVQLEVQDNLQNTVTLDTLTPTASGTITVSLAKVTSYPPGYLNALIIANHYVDSTTPAAPNGLTAQMASKGVALSWNDVSFDETHYQVYRSVNDTLHYMLVTQLPAAVSAYTDTSATGNTLYYYKVNCINGNGASGYTNQVSITTADKAPSITAISNQVVYNTATATLNVTATDNNGSSDHLTLSASGLPAFASFTDNGNGTGTISITPTTGLTGTYSGITVTATDLSDSSRSTSFNLNVLDTSISYTYLNITNQTTIAPAPWNNLEIGYLPTAGYQYVNLASQAGSPTGITVTLTDAWQNVGLTGMKRRNGSDLYPEAVSGASIYASDNNVRRITVTGLNPELEYNFQFFASHFTSESTLTNFTINGQTIALDGSQNSNKTAQVNGITPDNTGTVVIDCQRATGATYAMLSSLVIESYTPGRTTPFSPADLRKLDYTKSGQIALQWQDRSNNETAFELWRAPAGGSYSLLARLAPNTTTYVDSSLPANTAYDYIVRAVNDTLYSAYTSPVQGYTYQNTVYIAFNRTWAAPYNFPDAPAPFNNTLWTYQALGTVWNNFTDEKGLPTNVGLSQPTEWDEVDPFGKATGNNSGVFPDAAMDQGWLDFIGDSSYVTITGLDASKQYDLSMFASCTDDNTDNASAVYSVQGYNGVLNAHLNTSGTLTYFGLTPDGSGNINIGVKAYDSSNSSFGILGVVVVKGHTPFTNGVSPAPTNPTNTAGVTTNAFSNIGIGVATQTDSTTRPLSAYPNPFDQSFNLVVPALQGDNILVSLTDASGRVLSQQVFDNLYQGDNVIGIQPNLSLPKGFYFVKVTYLTEHKAEVLKMVKK